MKSGQKKNVFMPQKTNKSNQSLNILFLGDVVGRPGREAVGLHLPKLKDKLKLDFVVCNGENSAGGFGITTKTAQELYSYGVDVITLGDHTWDKPETAEHLKHDWRMLRPHNYPQGTPGKGFHVYPVGDGRQIAVVNLMGRVFINQNALDCPFQASQKLFETLKLGQNCDALIVDMHAEATSEKCCMGGFWDGHASLVVGTHTHIPTADAHIMPKGTGYQSDAGMCGVYKGSSLGADVDVGIKRFLQAGRFPLKPAEGEATVCGTFVQVGKNGLCQSVRPIRVGGDLQETL